MNTKVFSPIVQSSLPAQVINIENFILKIPFEVPSLVNINNVKHMQVIVIDQQTNKYISIPVNDFTTPDKVYYTNNFNNNLIQIEPTLEAGRLYKIQIRFGYCDLWENNDNFSSWKQDAINDGNFSEWSNVMIVKCLSSKPSFAKGLNKSPTNILTPNFYGLATFNSADEEYVDKYKFTLKYKNNILEETEWLTYIPIEPYYSVHKFKTILEKGETYEIVYSIISQNGYTASTTESVIAGANLFLELADATIQVTSDNENARNIVILNNLKQLQQYMIVRASEDTNYKIWEDVYSFQQQNDDGINYYSDFTIESGVQYRYGIQKIDSLGNRSNILEAEDICQTYFEYTYLVHDNKQLKLKFDTKLSSFKHTVLASKQDTLGSRYPTILRNGNAYYAEFPISGLISFNMDDVNTFQDQNINVESKTDLTHNNIYFEKQFRDKVEAFLNDGGYKLFKSATEGNLIITLMNIVLTPNAALGRMIYSFSATAYEVAEANLENMHKLGIITNGSIASANDILYLGDTIIFDTSMKDQNLFERYPELDTNLEIIEWPSTVITNLSSDSISCQIDGASITIKSGRQYICPIPITKELIISDESNDSNVTIDYTYSARPVAETLYEYGAETMWGQIEGNAQEEPSNLYDKLLELVAEKLDLDQNNIKDNVKLEFTVLRFDGTEGDRIKINDNDTGIILNKTGIWNLPTPMVINDISILKSTDLILMDYYCIINWKKKI